MGANALPTPRAPSIIASAPSATSGGSWTAATRRIPSERCRKSRTRGGRPAGPALSGYRGHPGGHAGRHPAGEGRDHRARQPDEGPVDGDGLDRARALATDAAPPAGRRLGAAFDLRPGPTEGPDREGAAGERKPITEEAVAALRRFDELNCWGTFSRDAMRHSFARACRRVEQTFKQEGVGVDLRGVRPYDLRHSYATAILAATGDMRTTQRLMLHGDPRTTERYARAAVDSVLVAALEQFRQYATGGRK